jgi:putative nucleotidyltransferase with HDIG domain
VAKSAAAKKEAMDATAEVKQFYDRGDVLVRRDSLMDNLQITLLEKEQEVYRATMKPRDRMVRLVGMTITVSFLVCLFVSYVSQYEPRVLTRRIRIIILMALAVVLVAITRFFVQSPLSLHLIPMALFAMSVAVAYNPLFAVGYTLFLAILVGITTGGDFALSISLFLGSIMGVMTIGRVRSRTTAFWAGLAAGLGTFIATWGTGLLFHADYDYKVTLSDSSFGLVNGLFCGAVITVLLPFIENTFGVITELSLFELVDLNKPILRRLALEAPGSYNHSLMVGNLADSAAEVIGASRLLARAGGYYHDIGKLSKPDYFVENRGTAASRHYNLSPTMSTLIIISHVKDAVEIAREYKLPSPVVDIIREHHGTTLVEYFYREAIEQAGDAAQVSDQSFRYPGPRPQTKEAAIVMLADSVESASRTITEPTPSKLESLVADIAKGKLEDGQFDECNLTMAELRQIEVSLTKSLAGVFHSRIKYPGREL